MPTEKRPDWLVPQENGVIGESRTRSFLLDRFDNWWGDIPEEFERLRERASRAQWDFSDVLEKLREIECSNDPEHALAVGRGTHARMGR